MEGLSEDKCDKFIEVLSRSITQNIHLFRPISFKYFNSNTSNVRRIVPKQSQDLPSHLFCSAQRFPHSLPSIFISQSVGIAITFHRCPNTKIKSYKKYWSKKKSTWSGWLVDDPHQNSIQPERKIPETASIPFVKYDFWGECWGFLSIYYILSSICFPRI